MKPESKEFKQTIASIRERIATAKRRGTRSGFIDYHGCISVTSDFINILEETDKAAERGEFAYAYSVATLVLINLAKLASTADDSAGGVTDARGYVDDILEKVCSGVKYASSEAEYIYLQSIKDSKNKAFDDWDEFAYELILKTARLATEDNGSRMLAAAGELYGKARDRTYSSWADEYNALIQWEIIKATGSEIDSIGFIKENIKYDAIRRIAIGKAIAAGDFLVAENLCLEKHEQSESINKYSRPSEWRYLLFDIYDKSGNILKKIEAAEYLLFRFDTKYYAILKCLLIEKGVWDADYQPLLIALGERLPYHLFMKILSDEGEMLWLLQEIRKHPASVFDYGKKLSKIYPTETYMLCLGIIRSQAAESDNRIKYKKVCSLIKKLFDFDGIAEAEGIITELKTKYSRRPAMLDELEALNIRLAKKRKLQ